MFVMLYGGSRSGKTFIILRSIIIRALKCKSRHLIVRFRFNHAKASVWYDTLPKVMERCFPNVYYKENKADWFIEFANGSQIWLGGIDDKDRVEKILGNEYSTVFCNESSQISYSAVVMLMSRLAENTPLKKRFWFDCNPPSTKHWTYLLFIKSQDPETKEPKNSDQYQYLLMNPADNTENLPPEYFETLNAMPKRQRERFLMGRFLSDIEGALWTQEMIEAAKVLEHGEQIRTVIAVDPAVTSDPDSDETGIIVCSIDNMGRGIVEGDYTCKATPEAWANRVVNAYYKHRANYIVAEVNQGGDLVKSIIRNVDPGIKIMTVHASKGKFARAEPVAQLYEQGKIAHKPGLDLLETEQTEWVPMNSKQSPNRVDALVWGVSELMLKPVREYLVAI